MTDSEYHQLGYILANELWDNVRSVPTVNISAWLATALAIAEMACE